MKTQKRIKMNKGDAKEYHEIFGNVPPKIVAGAANAIFQSIEESPGFNIAKGGEEQKKEQK